MSDKVQLISKNIPRRFTLKTGIRLFIFCLLFLSTIFSNLTKGIFLSSKSSITTALQLNDISFGLFGSLHSIGELIGSLIIIYFINKIDRKGIIVFSLLLNAALSTAFTFTKDKIVLMICYSFIGFAKITLLTILPLWADQFALNKYKTLFLTLLHFAESFGIGLGYVITFTFGEHKYAQHFLLQSVLLLVCAVVVVCSPKLYFSFRVLVFKRASGKEEFRIRDETSSQSSTQQLLMQQHRHPSTASNFQIRQSNESTYEMDFYMKVKLIHTNKLFICSVFAGMMILTTQSGMNHWIIDYINTIYSSTNVTLFKDNAILPSHITNNTALVSYILLAIAAPIGGLLTITVVSLTFGNYEYKHATAVMFALYSIATVIANCIPYASSYYYFIAFTLGYFVLCSAIVPMIKGICIANITPSLKGIAFSFVSLYTNIGIVCSSYLYGIIHEHNKKDKPTFAMNVLVKIMILGVIFALLSMIFKCCNCKRTLSSSSQSNNQNSSVEDIKRDTTEAENGYDMSDNSNKQSEKLDS